MTFSFSEIKNQHVVGLKKEVCGNTLEETVGAFNGRSLLTRLETLTYCNFMNTKPRAQVIH